MWEAIIEKVLTRYLSEYLDGIERDKLRVGLLRGDAELTDLILKPETADLLRLPFSVVFGRIGKLTIEVSWSRWMVQDYDMRITVSHVHLLLKPRDRSTEKSTQELRQELREIKEARVKRKEQELLESLREKGASGKENVRG